MKHASAKILTPSRRTFIGGMGAGILALGARPLFAQDAPNRGGVLRIANYTQSTNDTCDPAKFVQAGDYMRARCFYNTLTWINAADEAIPELAESFEAIDDSLMRWRFKLASGVKFHDGSPLTVEDVRFSILRHKTVPSAASVLAENVVDVHADGADSVIIELNTPNIDFPLLIGTYHFSIIKDGTEDFTVPNGTGPFRVKEFRPGIRTSGVRFEDYWRNGLPYLDEFEIFSILDNEARVAALLSGDVHLINQLAGPAIDQVAGSDAAQILVTESRRITTMQYRMDLPMTDSLDFRLAMCYLMDRQRYLDVTLRGYGVIANDTPFMKGSTFYNEDLPQRQLDPDKAAFHFRQSGVGSSLVELNVSEASPFSTEIAQYLQREGTRIGMNIQIKRNPADSYWNSVSGQFPITAGSTHPRPTVPMNLDLAFRTGAAWNRVAMADPEFDSLLDQVNAVAEIERRREIYHRLQQILYDLSPMTIPAFMSYVDGMAANVHGIEPLSVGPLGGYDFANTAWLS